MNRHAGRVQGQRLKVAGLFICSFSQRRVRDSFIFHLILPSFCYSFVLWPFLGFIFNIQIQSNSFKRFFCFFFPLTDSFVFLLLYLKMFILSILTCFDAGHPTKITSISIKHIITENSSKSRGSEVTAISVYFVPFQWSTDPDHFQTHLSNESWLSADSYINSLWLALRRKTLISLSVICAWQIIC